MSLAIFDLDNTLIAGDSDYLWGEFVVENGMVDAAHYRQKNDEFYEAYQNGSLDIVAYLNFALAPLAGRPPEALAALHERFMSEKIRPIMLAKANDLIEHHRSLGDTLLIITATNRFVTGPIAEALGVGAILASEPELVDGCYTGKATGVPCFQQGKVTRLASWLADSGESLKGSHFYSDSFNDIPLLEEVDHPVAVDPDDRLAEYAKERGIKIISLR